MRFVQAQFSMKYEPQIKIRRNANQIEDLLQKFYGAPQVLPIPDDIAAEAPRIILTSHHNHSQISFSQISVDFTVNFDDEFLKNYEYTKDYIKQRIDLLKIVLKEIGIQEYFYFGLTYNLKFDIGEESPFGYIKQLLGGSLKDEDKLYEVHQRIATIVDEKYFINQQISTFKDYANTGINIPNLLEFSKSRLLAEGVSLSLDVNNRYYYLYNGRGTDMNSFNGDYERILELLEESIKKFDN